MTVPRLPVVVRRVVPIVIAIVLFGLGAMWFVAPTIARALNASNDIRPLEERAATLRRELAMPAPAPSRVATEEFEHLVPAEDQVPALMETLAQLAMDPPNLDEARSLSLEAGARITADGAEARVIDTRMGGQTVAPPGALDPRWALFPSGIEYTPITITFETTYERLGLFLWRLRNLPTLVEIRSLEVTRALPLLTVKVGLFALRRTAPAPAIEPARAQVSPHVVLPAAGGTQDVVGRVNRLTPRGGVRR